MAKRYPQEVREEVLKKIRGGQKVMEVRNLPVSKSRNYPYSEPHTTSAHSATYHFCTRLMVFSPHAKPSGVPLESSGLRFSSTRYTNGVKMLTGSHFYCYSTCSMAARNARSLARCLNPYNLPMTPCPVVSLLGEYPMPLFHGPHIP